MSHAARAAALLLALSLAAEGASTPHLIFIHADDLGWHAPGFREPSLLTPALDELRANGVELNGYYTYKYCSPTRASLLTGRFPFKIESTRNNLIPFSQEDGVNLNFTMLPAKLKAAGYKCVFCRCKKGSLTRVFVSSFAHTLRRAARTNAHVPHLAPRFIAHKALPSTLALAHQVTRYRKVASRILANALYA